jgi:hypothetical protein
MNELVRFSPGDLVHARGREWVVLPGTENETLRVRPLSGTEADSQSIHSALEIESVVSATFPDPDGSRIGPQDEALLMRDAFQLALRRGAGPFRSAGAGFLRAAVLSACPAYDGAQARSCSAADRR